MVVDDEMITVPPVECSSLFSMSLPQNSYYFQNVRHVDNPYAIAKRSKSFILYEQQGAGSAEFSQKQVGQTNLYHVRIVLLPGVGEILAVGGSEDAECSRLSDQV